MVSRVFSAMNSTKFLFAAALFSSVLGTASLSASAPTANVVNAEADLVRPVPMDVVVPRNIPRYYQNAVVRLTLKIDETGKPHYVHLASGSDPILEQRLLPVVAKWRFSPARLNGQAVAMDVELPLRLVETPDS